MYSYPIGYNNNNNNSLPSINSLPTFPNTPSPTMPPVFSPVPSFNTLSHNFPSPQDLPPQLIAPILSPAPQPQPIITPVMNLTNAPTSLQIQSPVPPFNTLSNNFPSPLDLPPQVIAPILSPAPAPQPIANPEMNLTNTPPPVLGQFMWSQVFEEPVNQPLTSIDGIPYQEIDPAGISVLNKSTQYIKVRTNGEKLPEVHYMTLSHFTNLKGLDLRGCNANIAGFRSLSYRSYSQLEELYLDGRTLIGITNEILYNCSKLRVLHISMPDTAPARQIHLSNALKYYLPKLQQVALHVPNLSENVVGAIGSRNNKPALIDLRGCNSLTSSDRIRQLLQNPEAL